jgi:hypothetical protein
MRGALPSAANARPAAAKARCRGSRAPPLPLQVFTGDMIGPILKGRRAELYWPDDNMWYLIEISNVNMGDRTAGGCRARWGRAGAAGSCLGHVQSAVCGESGGRRCRSI